MLRSTSSQKRCLQRPPRRSVLASSIESLEPRLVMANAFQVTNLVSDQAGVAQIQDPNLLNAWGIALGPTGGNFWVSARGCRSLDGL